MLFRSKHIASPVNDMGPFPESMIFYASAYRANVRVHGGMVGKCNDKVTDLTLCFLLKQRTNTIRTAICNAICRFSP